MAPFLESVKTCEDHFSAILAHRISIARGRRKNRVDLMGPAADLVAALWQPHQ
jgi:hypothetical protein